MILFNLSSHWFLVFPAWVGRVPRHVGILHYTQVDAVRIFAMPSWILAQRAYPPVDRTQDMVPFLFKNKIFALKIQKALSAKLLRLPCLSKELTSDHAACFVERHAVANIRYHFRGQECGVLPILARLWDAMTREGTLCTRTCCFSLMALSNSSVIQTSE